MKRKKNRNEEYELNQKRRPVKTSFMNRTNINKKRMKLLWAVKTN